MVIDWNIHWVTAQAAQILLLSLCFRLSSLYSSSLSSVVLVLSLGRFSFSASPLSVSSCLSVSLLFFSFVHKLFSSMITVILRCDFSKYFDSLDFKSLIVARSCLSLSLSHFTTWKHWRSNQANNLYSPLSSILSSLPPSLPPSSLSPIPLFTAGLGN